MTRAAFAADGTGAIVSASRSIGNAHADPKYAGRPWTAAVLAATLAMKADLAGVVGR